VTHEDVHPSAEPRLVALAVGGGVFLRNHSSSALVVVPQDDGAEPRSVAATRRRPSGLSAIV
jgi:hypothetical protein